MFRALASSNTDGALDEKSHPDAVGQVQDALALFDSYGVPRPEGLSLSRKSQPKASHDKTLQLCHSCGEVLSFEQQCSKCGHDFCYKCASERACTRSSIAGELQKSTSVQLHSEHTDGPEIDGASTFTPEVSPERQKETPKRGPVTTNPFYLADRLSKTPSSAPQITKSSARARRPRRLSDCVPRRFRNRSASESVEESSPGQRDEKNSRRPETETHSLCCSAPMNATKVQKNQPEGALSVNLQRRFDELSRHAEDLHKAQYLREHLSTAIDELDCGSDVSTSPRSIVARDQPSMETPTKQLCHSRLHDLSEDSKYAFGMVFNSHDIEQDAVTSRLRPEEAHVRGYGTHSIFTIPSSGKLSPNDSLSVTKEAKPCEPRTCLELLSNKHISNDEDIGSSPQTPRRSSGGEEPNENSRIFGADTLHSHGTNTSSPDALPDDQPDTNRARTDLPSTTGYKRHRQNTQLCPRPQTPSTGPDSWPILKKVGQSPREKPLLIPNSVPWSRPSLRKVSSAVGFIEPRSTCSTPSEWRRDLRKTDEPAQVSPSKTIPAGTPVSEWRSSLTKPERTTPRASRRSPLCESCNPTVRKPSTAKGGTSGRCSHRDSHSGHTHKSNYSMEDPFTEPRLSVRAIEHSLAWKRVQEDIEKRVNRDADEVPLPLNRGLVFDKEEQETENTCRKPPESSHSCN